jgi:predicted small lipoprotein YifL
VTPGSVTPRAAARSVLWLALIALAFGGATLSACGQKGQLYLPSQKKSKVPPTQQPQGTPPPGTTAPAPPPAASS